MRSRSRGRRRSVDKGTCGPGIQPRKKLAPGRRRCKEMREAPSGAPVSRGATESRAVTDPVHVRKHLEREPGDPRPAQDSSCLEKTRFLEFGPCAIDQGQWRGGGKPETFNFLGFTQGKWLRAVVGGHFRYYGVPRNQPALAMFRFRVGWYWQRALSRRSQNGRVLWDRMRLLITRWLPLPTVCHPYPLRRMGVVT